MKKANNMYKAALYMRLSKDDESSKESSSIGTQRKMLRSYADQQGFVIYDEYIDDGWSGTNFERPSWKRMIHDIEEKTINLVLTKDLSRLGRDYIAAGQYTEMYFPSKGVRYIAINDGYDSDNPYTDIAPIKNIVNELQARDTSKKIRSAFHTKMREGSYIGNFAPYGYRKDPENKNHLLVDPAAAPIVQEMFQRAELGSSPAEIARDYNMRGIETPAVYRCFNHSNLNLENYTKRKEWTSAIVRKMLKNMVYLGHVVQGKTTKLSFKSRITLKNPKEDWVIVKNMHESIVTQEVFDTVQGQAIRRTYRANTGFHNLFSGIAKCAECGRNMSTTGTRRKCGRYDLVCGGYKLYGSSECSNHFIDYDILYHVVLEDLKNILVFTEAEKKDMLKELQQIDASHGHSFVNDTRIILKNRKDELDKIIEKLYEDHVCGKLCDERFDKMMLRFEEEQKTVVNRMTSITRRKGMTVTDEKNRCDFSQLARHILDLSELTLEIVNKLIDKIEITQGYYEKGNRGGRKQQTIRIYYRFNN